MDLKKIKTYINRIPEDKLRNIVEEAVGKSEYLEDLIVDYVYENYSEERKELKEDCVKEALSSALDAFEEFDPFDEEYEDLYDDWVDLPKGSIKKLIGRELSWNDEPVELKEN